MKNLLISAALSLAVIFGANAQVWIGGGIGFESNSLTTRYSLNPGDDNYSSLRTITANSFSVFPETGFSLNEKFDLGLKLGFGTEKREIQDYDKMSAFSFSIAPFVQYKALELGKFQLICRATVGFESHKGYMFGGEDGIFFVGNDAPNLIGFGLNLTPFLHYVINDRFNVFAAMNFLSLNFASLSERYNGNKRDNISAFNFGIDANNVANTGAIQLGFICKF